MLGLWYPRDFLDEAPANRQKQKDKLKQLQKKHKWSGGDVPSGAWIAERDGEKTLYDYLFSATSRAIHFSAGEIMRRGWGMPGGVLTTDKPEFRTHRCVRNGSVDSAVPADLARDLGPPRERPGLEALLTRSSRGC